MSQARVTFQYKFKKVLAALVYLASQREKVTAFDKKKALNLLFLADKIHLLRYGDSIFGEYYRALPHGAVPQRTLDRLNKLAAGDVRGAEVQQLAAALKFVKLPGHKYEILRATVEADLDALSALELQVLDEVVRKYGDKDFEFLKKLAHTSAWRKAWDAKPAKRNAAPMFFEDFFEGDSDAKEGAFEQMIEEFSTRRALSARR